MSASCHGRILALILFDEVDRAAYNVWARVDAVWTEDAGRVDGNDNEESESEQECNKRWRRQLNVEVAVPNALMYCRHVS